MALTLLQLVGRVSGELGLSQPSNVIGSANNQTMQMLALAQSLGEDLTNEFEWRRLVRTYAFQTEAPITLTGTLYGTTQVTVFPVAPPYVGDVISGEGIPPYAEVAALTASNELNMNLNATISGSSVLTFYTQDYALPAGFNRMISDTNQDRTNYRPNSGSRSSQEWAALQGGLVSGISPTRYRIYQNKLRYFPAPTAVYIESFEYVSNYWVIATGGTEGTKDTPSADTDLFAFPDALMRAGLKYYFLNAKKLECADEMAKYMDLLSKAKAQDVPLTVQSLSPAFSSPLIGSIPEGSWTL